MNWKWQEAIDTQSPLPVTHFPREAAFGEISPKSTTNWGSNVQIPKLIGNIFSSNHFRGLRSDGSN